MDDINTMILVPHRGPIEGETIDAVWGRPSLRGHEVVVVRAEASLLAYNFNLLWCHALNEPSLRYCAMVHADVAPEGGWLDVLIDEIAEHDADIISAAIPIKDPRGLTSCGIGYPDEKRWRVPVKRFTLAELHELPRTFSATDAGYPDYPLLMNTGCWLADLQTERAVHWYKRDSDGSLRIHFAIRDEIAWSSSNGNTGGWGVHTQSEDWFWSHRIWQAGLHARVTRAIKIHHVGKFFYTNDRVWGSVAEDKIEAPIK
jgi:hypothetical protein